MKCNHTLSEKTIILLEAPNHDLAKISEDVVRTLICAMQGMPRDLHTSDQQFGFQSEKPASYRPISNLNIICEVLQRLYLVRFVPHVSPSLTFLQSAYRPLHLTETTLLKITSEMFEVVASG